MAARGAARYPGAVRGGVARSVGAVVGGFKALCRGLGYADMAVTAFVVVFGAILLLARGCEALSRLG